ncbi:MAG TPA: S8 family peptidase [Bacteroidales bacterium]|nr:S8 family peptidase [Bacteroidales bacterium]HSA43479.1 S8 family peptidase [Bacteroidales bacterium]
MKNLLLSFLTALMLLCFPLARQALAQEEGRERNIPGRSLVLKVKESHASMLDMLSGKGKGLAQLVPSTTDMPFTRIFPHHKPPSEADLKRQPRLVDLSRLYRLEVQTETSLPLLINRLMFTNLFEYVEIAPVPQALFIPDDEKLGSQYYLGRIRAFEAWDLCEGDSGVIVGIVDSGTDLDHEDLQDNLAYNYNDPVDGFDNDNDGFTDNFYGWDLGEMDPDPQVLPGGSNVSHGVHMCGIAAATTNNATGVAGTSFRCRFLPVRVNDANDYWIKAYEGIVYAADHGCKVINCSWGDPFTRGKYGQDIVDYATFNRDALVVAACGNSNSDVPFYPASYENVLSVGASGPADERMYLSPSYASSYGIHLDVCAPGKDIFNTWDYPYFYKSLSGTSMAAAVTSGAAALLRAYHPQYSALQTAELLRVTADVIDTVAANAGFEGMLGSGRINLLSALSDTSSPSVRALDPVFSDMNDSVFTAGDTIILSALFYNYLHAADSITVTCRALSPHAVMLDSILFIPSLPSLTGFDNQGNPFRFLLLSTVPLNTVLVFRLEVLSDDYHAVQYLELPVNKDYLDISTEQILTSITSRGRLGYQDNYHAQGKGFCYLNDLSVLFSGTFMIGNAYTRVSDAGINATASGFDSDFQSLLPQASLPFPAQADREWQCVFNDDPAGLNSLNVEVEQRTLLWEGASNAGYVIYEYLIQNRGAQDLSNLFAGLFADWDLEPFSGSWDRVLWDTAGNMSVTCSLKNGLFAGIAALSPEAVKHYAFDMDGQDGSICVMDGFSSQEKYNALKTNRFLAGSAQQGNNVAAMVSYGPFYLQAGDSLKLAFAMLAAPHRPGLAATLQQARDKYLTVPGISPQPSENSKAFMLVPNPADRISLLIPLTDCPGKVSLDICDMHGQVLQTMELNGLIRGTPCCILDGMRFSPGIYFVRISAEGKLSRLKWVCSR